MPHLTTFERIRVIDLFNNLPVETKCKFEVVAHQAFEKYKIKICDKSVRNLVNKWKETGNVGDKPRPNKQKLLISNRGRRSTQPLFVYFSNILHRNCRLK